MEEFGQKLTEFEPKSDLRMNNIDFKKAKKRAFLWQNSKSWIDSFIDLLSKSLIKDSAKNVADLR